MKEQNTERGVESLADDEPDRVAVRRRPAADDGGQAVQAGGERDGGHLEDAAHRRADVPAARRARAAGRGRGGCDVRQRVRVKLRPATADEKAAA